MTDEVSRLVLASARRNAGKTSFIVGAAKNLGKEMAYIKPFGDRLLYSKKRLWDYDASLLTRLFVLDERPENMTLGFDHSKLRYMYAKKGLQKRVQEMVSQILQPEEGQKPEVLFAETGSDLRYGASVGLDALSLAHYIDGEIVLMVSGNRETVVDDVSFYKKYLDLDDVTLKGMVLNKIHDVEDFKETHMDFLQDLDIPLLGILPYEKDLTHISLNYLADSFFAKVLAGKDSLTNVVESIFVGAMSADEAMGDPNFKKDRKLVITSGDRSDMILAALESNTSGIIVTNNILPSSTLVSKAKAKEIPLLIVQEDTYSIAKKLDELEPLLTEDNQKNIRLLEEMIRKNVDMEKLLE